MLTLEDARHLGKVLVILAHKVVHLKMWSVPMSKFGDLEAVGELCVGNASSAMSCTVSMLLFLVAP